MVHTTTPIGRVQRQTAGQPLSVGQVTLPDSGSRGNRDSWAIGDLEVAPREGCVRGGRRSREDASDEGSRDSREAKHA